jgi:uncharacterized OB-fold protein
MRRFLNQLKDGRFIISCCTNCKKKIWPPYEKCPVCYRRTSPVPGGKFGRVVEFSKSWMKDGEVTMALIDIDGILLLGSILEARRIAVGSVVELVTKGASPDGKIHFTFRTLGRFDSYTINR